MQIDDAKRLEQSITFLKRLLVSLSGYPKVLIVEDDPNDVFLFKRQLEKFMCKPTFCDDGQQAVELIKKEKFHLIFLDQKIPKLSGSEILQQTIGLREDTRVIVVTGYLDDPNMPRLLDKGAIIAFSKPMTEANLALFLSPI